MRFFTLASMLAIGVAVNAASPEEIRTAVAREFYNIKPAEEVPQWVESIDESGFWSDINYKDDSRARWQLERHLDRLVAISAAYRASGATDSTMLAAAVRGLENWFDNHYTNSNWWYAKIGVQQRMLPIAYLLDDKLPEHLRKNIDESLNNINSNDHPARPGGDRIQVISNHAKVLLWRRDFEGVDSIYAKIEKEARIAPYEDIMYDAVGGPAVRNNWRPSGRGVQADMSFHHRGDRINSTLTYGQELPIFFSYWAQLLHGSDQAFSPEAVNFVIDYFLDGVTRHYVLGRYPEPTVINREIARPGGDHHDSHSARQLMKICDGYRYDELARAADMLDGIDYPRESYAQHFRESDYFVYSRPAFQTAVRYHSERTANQEAAHNGEGIRNHFRGDGANMLSVTGKEYADIAPVYDFRLIPGVTSRLIPYGTPESWGNLVVLDSPISFAGAVNDSVYGAVAFDFIDGRTHDLRARKSWFFFDNEYLCLGAGINSTTADTVVTTVEQKLNPGGQFSQDKDWYFCSGNAYHIIDGSATATNTNRTGTWSNAVSNTAYQNDSITADVFTLYLDHCVAPEAAQYAYAVVPGAQKPTEHSFSILANTPSVQAVADTGANLVYIVFYEPGQLDTPFGRYGADRPCLLMAREGNVYVTDPARRYSEINIETPSDHITAQMPDGLLAGTSLKIK